MNQPAPPAPKPDLAKVAAVIAAREAAAAEAQAKQAAAAALVQARRTAAVTAIKREPAPRPASPNCGPPVDAASRTVVRRARANPCDFAWIAAKTS